MTEIEAVKTIIKNNDCNSYTCEYCPILENCCFERNKILFNFNGNPVLDYDNYKEAKIVWFKKWLERNYKPQLELEF